MSDAQKRQSEGHLEDLKSRLMKTFLEWHGERPPRPHECNAILAVIAAFVVDVILTIEPERWPDRLAAASVALEQIANAVERLVQSSNGNGEGNGDEMH